MTEYHPPAPEQPQSRGERTRLEILQAALALFTRQGYHGTSMRQIAERAGIALGGIYNHFESKEAIFTAVSLNYHPVHAILPALEASQGETIEEVVYQSADQMVAALEEGEDFLNLMLIEVVEFKGRHLPQIFRQVFPRALGFSARLREKRGRLREQVPLAVMVATFIGMVFAFFLFQRVFGSLADLGPPRQVLRQMLAIYLHGILEPEAGGGQP